MFFPLLLLVYAIDVALVSGTFEELKKRVEAWKGILESKDVTVNVKNKNMNIKIKMLERLQMKVGFLVLFAEMV